MSVLLRNAREIVLASASPRRRDLLTQIGVEFRVVTADIDEAPLLGEEPEAYVLRLAAAKARAVLARYPNAVVVGADTTVTVDGVLLGKPRDAGDARRMLRLLRNRAHQVLTGVSVQTYSAAFDAVETTTVWFGAMDDEAIDWYVGTGEPTDKAGAYAIQGRAARWIPRIEGDFSNVVGLPLARVHTLLRSASVDFL